MKELSEISNAPKSHREKIIEAKKKKFKQPKARYKMYIYIDGVKKIELYLCNKDRISKAKKTWSEKYPKNVVTFSEPKKI